HQAFAGEDGVVGRNAAPPAHPQRPGLGFGIFDAPVGDVIGRVHCAIQRVFVHAVFYGLGTEHPRHHRTAGHAVAPGGDPAVAVDRRRHHIAISGTVHVLAHIFFTRPDHFDRAVHLLGDADRFLDHVGVEPPAKAAAQHVIVEGHLVLGDA